MNSIKKLLVATLVVLGIAGCATGKENSSQTTSATAENKKNTSSDNKTLLFMI